MQHLKKVWISGVAKAINKYMTEFLNESLDDIYIFLRVSPYLDHVICEFQKEFSLTANYTKGHGEKFRTWMMKRYQKEVLDACQESDRQPSRYHYYVCRPYLLETSIKRLVLG